MDGRCISGCEEIYHSFAHGSKGTAVLSAFADCGSPSATFRGLQSSPKNKIWQSSVPGEEGNPYRNEWNDLVDAILHNKPYNEVQRGVEASLATSMGRRAAHTGKIVTWNDMLHSEHEFAPAVEKLTMDGPAPLLADAEGRYPVPQPGIVTNREY
jgi:hypothetical protein